MTSFDRVRNWSSLALCAVGVVLLSYWVFATIEANAFQNQLARRLETLSPSPSASSAGQVAHATRREANSSGLVGRLEIPRLGVSAMITEGVTDHALGRGIGHVPDTPLPGEPGNVGLAAHRDSYFRRLKDVAPGDRIQLFTPDGVFSYEVDWIQVVDPDRIDLLADTFGPALTLVTCYPFHWVGNAPKRFVVRCRPAGERGVSRGEPLPTVVAVRSPDEEEPAMPIAAQAEALLDVASLDSLLEADPAEIR